MKIKHIVTILGLALSFSTIIPTINSNALSKTIVNIPSKFLTIKMNLMRLL